MLDGLFGSEAGHQRGTAVKKTAGGNVPRGALLGPAWLRLPLQPLEP